VKHNKAHDAAVAEINEHRVAVGRRKFSKLTPAEVKKHQAKINQEAPYGNDPWA